MGVLKRWPTPKEGDLLPKVLGKWMVKSVGVFGFWRGKRLPLLNEKRWCAVLKLTLL